MCENHAKRVRPGRSGLDQSNSTKLCTLRAETFAGRNFRVFRVFGPFSRKFMPLEISKQQNAKVFSREIIDNFKNAKVFSSEKKLFFQANLSKFVVIKKIKDTWMDIINTYTIFSFFQSINPLQ